MYTHMYIQLHISSYRIHRLFFLFSQDVKEENSQLLAKQEERIRKKGTIIEQAQLSFSFNLQDKEKKMRNSAKKDEKLSRKSEAGMRGEIPATFLQQENPYNCWSWLKLITSTNVRDYVSKLPILSKRIMQAMYRMRQLKQAT